MKRMKYVVAGFLMMGLSLPAVAQNANYSAMLKPIEQSLKDNPNMDAKTLKNLTKDYQKEFKKDPKALVALGEALLINKQYDEASNIGNAVIAKYKDFGDAYILLGDIAAMKDDGGNAAMWYEQSMTMDPKNPQGYMRYANVYRKRSPEESERALNLLKQNCPDFPIEAEAGNNFYLAGNYAKAFEYFSKSNKEDLAEYYLVGYAVSAYMANKKEESLDISKLGIQKFAKNITFDRVALWSAVDLQKYDEAINYAKIVLNTDSVEKSARDYIYYGLALRGNKVYDEAIAQYQKAFDLNKEDYKPYQYMADTYAEMGQEDKALECNEVYMAHNQNATPSDYAKLANIYVQKAEKGGDGKQANFCCCPYMGCVIKRLFLRAVSIHFGTTVLRKSCFCACRVFMSSPTYLAAFSRVEMSGRGIWPVKPCFAATRVACNWASLAYIIELARSRITSCGAWKAAPWLANA